MKYYCIALLSVLSLASSHAQSSLAVTKLGQFTYLEKINDVWGWEDQGREYALVGVENGLSIVEISNPTNPVEKLFVPGAISTWRDMKTYQNYGYAVHDLFSGSSDGILVVDLSTLDNQFPSYWNRLPTIDYNGQQMLFQRGHNIYVDENGYLYVFGSNIGNGGALIFDLKPDPTNPTYVGMFDQYYLHDGVARGDTLWGAAVTSGFFSAINVNSKINPTELGRKNTPSGVSHNVWFSDDNQRVFTTDEVRAAWIAEYDVSDLSNITELDRIKTSFGPNVVPHNAHFHNNFLVNSYYTSGLQIVDVSVPGIMVETAYYDTSPASGSGFSGAWGAYPYLPSGRILASDREQGLFILSSTYPRASFLVATVLNSTNNSALSNARIKFLNGDIDANTSIFGIVREGQAQAGTFDVEVSKSGFITDTFQVNLTAGQVNNVQFPLRPVNVGMAELTPVLEAAKLFPTAVETGGGVTLQVGELLNQDLLYRIYNAKGAQVKMGTLNAAQKEHFIGIDFQSGLYFLKLSTAKGHSRNFKLLVR